ncbi:hypothetical protein CROQUDRAFT_649968 [Cronartium quercuum f. sp. fusiforme G11]|uniref:Uncharacterized protein n=1 Tax=Cronartium quercuum f. sp. fusiforme G11 TaxID=708437 RepID=A0A9P6NZV9_9BASI|nr:hypothetical protein CROQUDRAFT_649968 [Cronartium quercuum f. sp. fusiforme G11]
MEGTKFIKYIDDQENDKEILTPLMNFASGLFESKMEFSDCFLDCNTSVPSPFL